MDKPGFIDCNAGAIAIERLKRLQAPGDAEGAHSEADEVLCWLLEKAGYSAVVEEWKKVERWYA